MARLFDANTEYLSLGSAALSAAPLTFACWFYPNDLTTTSTLVTITDGAAGIDAWGLSSAGASAGDPIRGYVAQANAFSISEAGTYAVGSWQHAAMTATTSAITSFYNGVAGTPVAHTKTPSGMDRTYIGVYQQGATFVTSNARIAWVGIWNVVLAQIELTALAAGVHPLKIRPGNLVACVPVWGIQSPEQDLMGASWTVNGSPGRVDDPPVEPLFDGMGAASNYFDVPALTTVAALSFGVAHGGSMRGPGVAHFGP